MNIRTYFYRLQVHTVKPQCIFIFYYVGIDNTITSIRKSKTSGIQYRELRKKGMLALTFFFVYITILKLFKQIVTPFIILLKTNYIGLSFFNEIIYFLRYKSIINPFIQIEHPHIITHHYKIIRGNFLFVRRESVKFTNKSNSQ